MESHPSHRQRSGRLLTPFRVVTLIVVLVVLAAAGLAGVQLSRATPGAGARIVLEGVQAVPGSGGPALPWPAHGEAAVEVEGYGSLGGVREQREVPLASITKLVTALVVLRSHPLRAGHRGPTLTITPAEVRAYRAGLRAKDSEVAIKPGERLSERQALEGLLIPSGDDVADILARWVAKRPSAFDRLLNAEARRLGMSHTHLVGPSGLSARSVGTVADLLPLAGAVLADPVLRRIVAMPQVTLPVAGLLYNFDYAVGHDGIIGIKTGSTSAAGGNFVFAAVHRQDGHNLTVVGAVLGQGGTSPLQQALDAGERLASAAAAMVQERTVVPADQPAISIHAPWGPTVEGKTTSPVALLAIPGEPVTTRVEEAPELEGGGLQSIRLGQQIGTVDVTVGGHRFSDPVLASGSLAGPSLGWRLTRT